MERDEKDRSRRLATSLALFTILGAAELSAASGPARLALDRPETGSALERAVSQAVRQAADKLDNSSCREIFSDFRDSSGRTMRENLEKLGKSPQGYLDHILFYNGYGYSRCDPRSTFASTSPGSQVVYICAPQFLEKQHREPGQAAVLIIHEELHSLGLGEDPPSSKEITARVIARCGQ